MRSAVLVVLSLLLLIAIDARGDDAPMCGTSAEHDQYLAALHARPRALPMATANATLRDGAFYLPSDDAITIGYRPIDLDGQSLVFEPRGASTFAMHRGALDYVAPSTPLLRDFQNDRSGTPWYSVAVDLPFTFSIFGRSVTRVYVTAFNEIRLDVPAYEQTAMQFGVTEAAVQPQAVLSPLVITTSKPRYLAYPRVYVDSSSDTVRVTWSSVEGSTFGYELQAALHSDGRVTYSYASVRNLRWGAPLLTPGFDSATATRTVLQSGSDPENDVTTSVAEDVRAMLDIRSVEVSRVTGGDIFAIRAKVGRAIDATKLAADQTLRYLFFADGVTATIDITRNGVTVLDFEAPRAVVNGVTARVTGDNVEMFGLQQLPEETNVVTVRVVSYLLPDTRVMDASSSMQARFTPAPYRTARDLSAIANDSELAAPIVEPFILGELDVYEVWNRLQEQYKLSNDDVDGVAIYQSFFTDIIFYAGAYSTRGNPAVDGIAPGQPPYRSRDPRMPALLHMNQLTYNYSSADATASKVLLHEFGHRWLYFFSINENGAASRALNPVSAHPAAFVHTPSAFPVYGEHESSVMGGAYFTAVGSNTYQARAANFGYSWTDLYLMGLASPDEVPSWFYLANTTLPKEYWPEDGAVVANAARRDVALTQLIDVHGPRVPSSAISQRKFRLLFVLVTGAEPTVAEVAQVNAWRSLAERNFLTATGGRGRLDTTYVRVAKTRVVR